MGYRSVSRTLREPRGKARGNPARMRLFSGFLFTAALQSGHHGDCGTHMRLGIDFGTTRTVVAAVDRGNYPILSFEDPDGAMVDWFPSLVAVRPGQRLYGWQAWACQQYPNWTIVRSLKRVLQDAGPATLLQLGDEAVPFLQR